MGDDRRDANGAVAGQHRSAVSRSVQRRHLEPRGDLAARARATASASATSTSISTRRRSPAGCRTTGRSSNRLTLNLGLRYDLEIGAFANDVSFPPFQEAGRPNDKTNFQPRVGFAYRLTDRTVVRGGIGPVLRRCARRRSVVCDRQRADCGDPVQQRRPRPDFAANPTNGQPLPTYAGAAVLLTAAFCLTRNNNAPRRVCMRDRPGVRRAAASTCTCRAPGRRRSASSISSATTMAVEADYVYSQGTQREGRRRQHQPDVQPGDRRQLSVHRSRQPAVSRLGRRLDEHASRPLRPITACRPAFTKRFSNRWQASATYTLSGLWNADTKPFSGLHAGAIRRPRPIWAANGGCRPTISAIGRCSTASGRWATASR